MYKMQRLLEAGPQCMIGHLQALQTQTQDLGLPQALEALPFTSHSLPDSYSPRSIMVFIRSVVTAWVACSVGMASQASSRPASAPTVTVKNGTYTGIASPAYNQEFFLGMPYAQNATRFTQAVPLNTSWTGTHAATAYPPHCVGYGSDDDGYTLSENCLYINVVRPAGVATNAKLPVAVWIHGGGLYMGGSADKRYNLTFIVENSVQQGTPMIGVSFNYRLSAFGFIGGKQALEAGLANMGFHDQRLALRWVNENIAAFGGAADKVSIWGESSGAESVSAQVLAYNGRDDGLFRGAMAESGFGGVLSRNPGNLNATAQHQAAWDDLVNRTSCAPYVGTAAVIKCMRNVAFSEINAVLTADASINPTAWSPAIDGDFIADYPYNQLRDGRFVKIPVLIGSNSDEGTAKGGSINANGTGGVSTDAEFRASIIDQFGLDGKLASTTFPGSAASTPEKAAALVDELMVLYPNIQAIGVPDLAKLPVIVAGDAVATASGLQFRRASAIYGDNWMHYYRRRASEAWSAHGLPSWSYRFDVLVNGVAAQFGATHFQEVAFVFNNVNGLGYATNPFANESSTFIELSKTMSKAWVNFVTVQDPNGSAKNKKSALNLPGSVTWPVYNATSGGGVGHNVVFQAGTSYIEADTYRAEAIGWMINHGLDVFGS